MTEAGYARILLDKKDTQIMELESEITKLRIEYERQIMELQKENTELKKSCDETQELLDKQIEATYKLDKENAELKSENQKWKDEWQEQIQKAIDEGYARTLQTIQLTKAKKLLRYYFDCFKNDNKYTLSDFEVVEDTEQFLSEVEE